jgi:acetoin utilization protein AcuB
MFVRDCMTPNPIAIRPESDPLVAVGLMKSAGFRHLPVLDGEGGLVGIVDRSDLELFLSTAGSPGIMKRNHRVDQVMQREVIQVTPECPLEEAAALMVQHKIGSLPVVEAGKLVGIITETDIFKRLAAVLGGGTDSLRLTVQVDDLPGQLAGLAGCIARVQGNIVSVVGYPSGIAGRMNFTLRVTGIERETLLEAISDFNGIEVLDAWGCE